MNEEAEKVAPCTAITEKKPQRPGGCVGIFFQLFDWNRRFAKRKLFSRKLLPPVRAKHASKRFGEEKMPNSKLQLIADENGGGFPHVRNSDVTGQEIEPRREIRAPGLVARLMGLESLPATRRDKSRKSQLPEGSNVTEKFSESHGVFLRENSGPEKENPKVESRPQKIQRMDLCDRRTMPRFGTEALHIRSVLSRSRKQRHKNHSKFASPVRSPRLSNPRNNCRTSRLIGAATRILEPGIQATSRAKSSITYPKSLRLLTENRALPDEVGVRPPHSLEQSGVPQTIATPCRNCGAFVDVVHSGTFTKEQSSASPSCDSDPQLEMETVKPIKQSLGYRKHVSIPGGWEQSACPVSERVDSAKVVDGQEREKKRAGGRTQRQVRTQRDEKLIFGFRQEGPQMLQSGKMASEPRPSGLRSMRTSTSSNGSSAAPSQTSVSRTRPGSVSKVMGDTNVGMERKALTSCSSIRTPVRKRRIPSANGQIQTAGGIISTRGKQNMRGEEGVEKNLQVISYSRKNDGGISRLYYRPRAGSEVSGSNDNNVVCDQSKVCRGTKGPRKIGNDCARKDLSPASAVTVGADDRKMCLQKQAPLTGDALGNLLEEKLRELTSQGEDGKTSIGSAPKKSTVKILQEIISALTVEQPITAEFDVTEGGLTDCQTRDRMEETASLGFAHDGNYMSPGSVLEASFSSGSCFSSSFDDISGGRLNLDAIESSERPRMMEYEADFLQSETSLKERTDYYYHYYIITSIIRNVSSLLRAANIPSLWSTKTQLAHAEDVLINSELVLKSLKSHDNTHRTRDFLIFPSLLDKLEVLADTAWNPCYTSPGIIGAGDGDGGDGSTRRFVFDCLIEYLESKYSPHSSPGFRAWKRWALFARTDRLARDVVEEVQRWTRRTGMVIDDIIHYEMSRSLGKWMDFDEEAYETGTEIDSKIFHSLIEEIVSDYWSVKLVSP